MADDSLYVFTRICNGAAFSLRGGTAKDGEGGRKCRTRSDRPNSGTGETTGPGEKQWRHRLHVHHR